MPRTITAFNTRLHHIYIIFFVTDGTGACRDFRAIIDTGAPRTEFNDAFLELVGFDPLPHRGITIKDGMQTQKYGKLIIPSVEICDHTLEDYEVMVSHIDRSWGIAALIGLDFFRRFRVTIDYEKGLLTTEPF